MHECPDETDTRYAVGLVTSLRHSHTPSKAMDWLLPAKTSRAGIYSIGFGCLIFVLFARGSLKASRRACARVAHT